MSSETQARALFRLNLLRHVCRIPVERVPGLLEFDRYADSENVAIASMAANDAAIVAALRDFAPTKQYLRRYEQFRQVAGEAAELAEISRSSVQWVAFGCQGYPRLLQRIDDPPLVLYHRGCIDMLTRPCVAIVGSRATTAYGRSMAEKIAQGLADAGVTVVSGLARGIDAAAHRGALSSVRGGTAAILGCGVTTVYPKQNGRLHERIAAAGAVLSELPLSAGPKAWHFPLRNRLIAGCCLATVVVEASSKSGSLITAQRAWEQGRHVMAVPGNVGRRGSDGTNELIRNGAGLVRSARDVLELLAIEPVGEGRGSKQYRAALGEEAYLVYRAIEEGHTTLDEVLSVCSLEYGRLNRILFALLEDGYVEREPGGLFRVTVPGAARAA